MEPAVQSALSQGGIADITTTGRKTGTPHRIEIGFQVLSGDYFITGQPGRKRDWLANLSANPDFTLHLTQGVTADVPVTVLGVSSNVLTVGGTSVTL